MLILTRFPNESIRINNDTTLTVIEVRGNQVRIGIDAPQDVAVHREEIYQKILRGEPKPEKREWK